MVRILHKLKITFLLLVAICLFSNIAHAGLKDTLRKLETSWNVTEGGAYDSQAAGFITGGSMSMRSPIANQKLMNVRPPSITAGCGGIDAHLGSMSFIKAKELIQALKTIPSNMAGYAMQLTLQTQAPQIYNIVNEMFAWIQKMNALSINSCETAQSLVNGMWSQMNMSSDHACKAMTAAGGKETDWFSARQSCGQDRASKIEDAKGRDEYKDQLGSEFNLVWEALKKKGPDAKNTREIFMSISGTIISRSWKDGAGKQNKKEMQVLPFGSLALNEKFIEMMLYGGAKAKRYKCDGSDDGTDSDKCLYPTEVEDIVEEKEAYVNQVTEILSSLQKKAHEDIAPDDREKRLIEATSIPILKIISVQSAFKEGVSVISNLEVAETIAWDIFINYLDEITTTVEDSLSHIEGVQIDGKHIQQLKDNIYKIKRLIATKKQSVYQRMLTVMNMVDSIMQQESYLRNNMSNYAQLKEGGDNV